MIFENRFKGKTMLVTGGTSGIGRAVCIRAALEGAKVIVVGRSIERGEEVVKEITTSGGEGIFIKADMSSEEELLALFGQIEKTIGTLDIAINNAGIVGHGERIDELSTEEWNHLVSTNLTSAFICCREESKSMIKGGKGGSIVNVGSIAGVTGFYRSAAYVASKHGLNGLTKAVANDLAMLNIRCNSINPAGTSTPLSDRTSQEVKAKLGAAMATGRSLQDAMLDTMVGGKTETLQKRNATSEEQAASILYLASEEAAHITGSIVMSDGGYTAY